MMGAIACPSRPGSAARLGRLIVALFLVLAGTGATRASGLFSLPDLLAASDSGDISTTRDALLRGDDPDIVDDEGRTPLIRAVRHGFLEIIRLLIDGHADLKHVDRDGKSALYWAADSGHDAALNLLLDGGAPVDQPAKGGVTPLMAAAARGDDIAVERLLAAGADATRSDHTGRDALGWADDAHNPAVLSRLRRAAAKH